MLPDRVSNPGPLTYESGALPIALRGPAAKSYSAHQAPKLNHIPHIKRFEILVYNLTDNFIHFVGRKPNF